MEPKEGQVRTLKMKVHKSVDGGTVPAGPRSPAATSQMQLGYYYEGYLIVDVRIALALVGLCLFLTFVVLLKFRVLSAATLLGPLRACRRGQSPGSSTRKEL